MKRVWLLFCLCLSLTSCTVLAEENKESVSLSERSEIGYESDGEDQELLNDISGTEVEFEYWNRDAESLAELIAYVEDVTDEASPHFIPEEFRIAAFDLDGTLYSEQAPFYTDWCMFAYRVNEDPDFLPDDELKEVGEQIAEAAITGFIPGDLSLEEALKQYAKAFAGMTVEGYRQYVREFCSRPVAGFEGMTFKEAFFKPMINVVDYLNANGFTVYICSGSDRTFCRELTEGVLAIADNHVIGMDVMLKARGQGDTEGLKYVYTSDDAVVRTDELLMQNTKMNKVSQLAQEVGNPPVLCFGNSSGDESMAVYTTSNNPYYSKAFMLIADDSEREYGNEEKAGADAEKWREHNWVVISMKNDFKTIYGDNVNKTSKS